MSGSISRNGEQITFSLLWIFFPYGHVIKSKDTIVERIEEGEEIPMYANSNVLLIGVRLLVFVTLVIFIIIMERNMSRAHVRGRIERLLEIVAAFVMGIVVRGLILLLP